MSTIENKVKIWIVYEKPMDYPNSYVARLFLDDQPTRQHYITGSLEMLKERFKGMSWIDREPDDDPCILGVYF
jgi:hypothetical protein